MFGFICLAINGGVLYSYGVYQEEYERLFDRKDEVEGPGALGSGTVFIGMALLSVFYTTRYSCNVWGRVRPLYRVMLGGGLVCLGLLLAGLSHHIWQLCLTQGLMAGLGIGILYMPLLTESSGSNLRRGILHMGTGVGGLVLSPISRFLLEKQGTQGSLRWLSLICLVGTLMGCLGTLHRDADEWPSSIPDTYRTIPGICTQPLSNAVAGKDQSATHRRFSRHVHFAPEVIRKDTIHQLEMTQDKQARRQIKRELEKITENQLQYKCWRQMIWMLGVFLGQVGWLLVLLFMPSLCMSRGSNVDVHTAALLLGSLDGSFGVGQFVAGYVVKNSPLTTMVLAMWVGCLTNIVLLAAAHHTNSLLHLLVAYSIVYGTSSGVSDALGVISGYGLYKRAGRAVVGLDWMVASGFVVLAPCSRLLVEKLGGNTSYLALMVLVCGLLGMSAGLLTLVRVNIYMTK